MRYEKKLNKSNSYARLKTSHLPCFGFCEMLYTIKKGPKLNSKTASAEDLNLADKFYYNYRHWRDKSADNQILVEEYRSGEKHNKEIRELKETIKKNKEYIQQVERLYGETYATDKWIIRSLRKLLEDNNIQYNFWKIEDDAIEKVLKI